MIQSIDHENVMDQSDQPCFYTSWGVSSIGRELVDLRLTSYRTYLNACIRVWYGL